MNTGVSLKDDYFAVENDWVSLGEVVADPVKFAARFNNLVPGACRCITAEDIRSMSRCGLIGRCGFFTRQDVETVRGILRYEQLKYAEKP